MLKILFFSGGNQILQILPGLKSLYDQNRKSIHLLVGEAQFGTGEAVSANLSTGKATGAHVTGSLRQGVSTEMIKKISCEVRIRL